MALLEMGSRGPDVEALQRELNLSRPADEQLTIDGDFGPDTRSAVEAYQRQHGLTVDGEVGPATHASLQKKSPAPPKKKPAAPPEAAPPPPPKPSGGPTPDEVSLQALHEIMPHLSTAHGDLYIAPLNRAMQEFFITTRLRKAAFLAQIAEESVELLYFHEIASGWEYDVSRNPKLAHELGNDAVGDGPLYKGRGPIQLTGKSNYRIAGNALHLDLVDHPDIAASPNVGFRVAGWFWVGHGLNGLADAQDFREITRRINGGYNGYSVRLAYYEKALAVL